MARGAEAPVYGDSRWFSQSADAPKFSPSSGQSGIYAHAANAAAPGPSLNRHGAGASFYSDRVGVLLVKSRKEKKLLGNLSFVCRTFEGRFSDSPYVLDMDANLYIGPADQLSRDEHAGIEVIYHFLRQTGMINHSMKELLHDRVRLLEAFCAFDQARVESQADEFQIFIFGTYDGEPLADIGDDDLPAGPCGKSINAIKRHFYAACRILDKEFDNRKLEQAHKSAEAKFKS